jgi:hypothetical protein
VNTRLLPARIAATAAACATAAALTASAAPAAGTARPARPASALIAATPRPVLLPNGDQVLTPAPGRAAGTLLPAPHSGMVLSLRLGRRTELIPAAALPYLGRGLDPSLFDLDALRKAESGGRLPVQITFTRQRPDLPGVRYTRSGRGRAEGYLTAASARVLGAALIRQFRADHARASYGRDGIFAGRVTISLPGAPPPARRRPQFPMHTVTITGTSLAGKPDTGDAVFVFNAADIRTFGWLDFPETVGVFYHGTARFSVPAGTYWAFSLFFSDITRTSVSVRTVVVPQFTVQGNTRLHLAARAATSKLGASTPRSSKLQAFTFSMVRTGLHGPRNGQELIGDAGVSLWVSPTTVKPTVGTLRTYVTQTLASPPHAAGPPYTYNLVLAGPAGIVPDEHAVIRQRSLATVTEHFYQEFTSTGTVATLGDGGEGGIGLPLPVRLPGTQTQYMTGNPAVVYGTVVCQFPGPIYGGCQSGPAQTLRAGQRLSEVWNNYPLHPLPAVQGGSRRPSGWVTSWSCPRSRSATTNSGTPGRFSSAGCG